MLTCEQRERLLGMVLLGTSTETAAASLGISIGDISEQEDRDAVFRNALYSARTLRDALEETMREFGDSE